MESETSKFVCVFYLFFWYRNILFFLNLVTLLVNIPEDRSAVYQEYFLHRLILIKKVCPSE